MSKISVFFVLFMLFTGTVSLHAVEGETVFFSDAGGVYYASSELEKPAEPMEIGRYSPKNLFDHDVSTSWVEGDEGSGEGAFVIIGTGRCLKDYMIIYNGYQASKGLFLKNNRVRKLKVYLYAGFTGDWEAGQFGFGSRIFFTGQSAVLSLEDRRGAQRFTSPFNTGEAEVFRKKAEAEYRNGLSGEIQGKIESFYCVKFEILSVFKGSKWDDTCISEIEFTDNPDGSYIPVNEKILKLYQKTSGGNVYVKTSDGSEMLVVNVDRLAAAAGLGKGEFLTADILDTSPSGEWAVIAYQHGAVSGGSVEETYHLWSVRRMEELPPPAAAAYGLNGQVFFTVKNGKPFAETYDGRRVLLEELETAFDDRCMN